MVNQTALYGDELLVAALSQAKPRSTFKVKSEARIVQALYKISRNPELTPLFKNYTFDTDGLIPRSMEVSEGIQSLQQSRLLKRQNPDLVEYTISSAIKDRFDRFVKQKVVGSEKQIEELGKALCQELNIDLADGGE
jgi:hypothetical protein